MPAGLWKGYLISAATSHTSEKLIITDTAAMIREDEMKSGACTHAANIRFQSGPHIAYPSQEAAETLQKWKPFLYQWLHLTSIWVWWQHYMRTNRDNPRLWELSRGHLCGLGIYICVLTFAVLGKRHSHWKNWGKLGPREKKAVETCQSPPLLSLWVYTHVCVHTCMCTHKALSHKEDHITPTAPCPVFLN